jgi:hypothetical protein
MFIGYARVSKNEQHLDLSGTICKPGQHRLCWFIRNRVRSQSYIERLKDRDITHIPLVTRALMALELGDRKVADRASCNHVDGLGLRLPRWRCDRRVMRPRPCSTPLSLNGHVAARVIRLRRPHMVRRGQVSRFSDTYGPTVNGTSTRSPMIVDVPGFVSAPIQR